MTLETEGPRPMPHILLDDQTRRSRVTYDPEFLDAQAADTLFAFMSASTPFHAEAPVMFGRPVEVRRRTFSYGDPGTRYRYSGVERVATPWPAPFHKLLDRLEQRVGVRFGFALCNLYPDGGASIGWHSDDEADLAAGMPIASVSLGATRDFVMRVGRSGPACVSVSLAHGSLLVMSGETQAHFQHAVPKRTRCREPRINLTFRVMKRTELVQQ